MLQVVSSVVTGKLCFSELVNTVSHIQESEMETEEEVDILMSSDVYSATLSTKSITFSRAQTGWLFREDKTVGVAAGDRFCWTDICHGVSAVGGIFFVAYHRQKIKKDKSSEVGKSLEPLLSQLRVDTKNCDVMSCKG